MSARPISRSPDLTKLVDEGYELEIRDGFLLVHSVPYVTSESVVAHGTLVVHLTLAGDTTTRPGNHVAYFVGGTPCDTDGNRLDSIIISDALELAPDLKVDHQFSSKPQQGYYDDHFEQVSVYAGILSAKAQAIDPEATAKTHGPIRDNDPDSVFEYMDTATSRAGIGVANEKLGVDKVAIVGLGGTGSYVLDLLAKTPIGEIHLFDGDVFLSHNAFRSPGAAALDELRAKPMKTDHFKDIYSKMHRGIVSHAYAVEESNVDELRGMGFVFICVDHGPSRQLIVEKLIAWGQSFIDVGMGANESEGSIGASVRVTTSTPDKRDHLDGRLNYGSAPDDDYRLNIQIADLNALNATLAVIRWRRFVGYYDDLEHEHNSIYNVDVNSLINEDCA